MKNTLKYGVICNSSTLMFIRYSQYPKNSKQDIISFSLFALQKRSVYKATIALYLVCFFFYVLFTRKPDYFEGQVVKGTVTQANNANKESKLVINILYRVGPDSFLCKANLLPFGQYKIGEKLDVIYDPSQPAIASVYAFFGYWLNWDELLVTAIFFVVFFVAAVFITGKSETSNGIHDDNVRKRKYDD